MKLTGSPQSHGVCLQARRDQSLESLTAVQPGDLVTVWNAQLKCQSAPNRPTRHLMYLLLSESAVFIPGISVFNRKRSQIAGVGL